ncbi:MAG: hypothetical protein A2Y33_01380 [Spirochaetes bacterium GWF1_51_8]|nr:MAG: hypothetical protein A2Y33_01380 [Spirochaetes bacterium GWF1_51_8]
MTEFYDIAYRAAGFFTRPFSTLSEILYQYRERILFWGIIFSVTGQISMAVGEALLTGGAQFSQFGFFITHIFYRLFMNYFGMFILAAIVFFIMNRAKPDARADHFAGAFFLPDFLLIFLLPLSLIFKSVPVLIPAYFIFMFALTVYIYIIKLKAISLVFGIGMGKSFGLMLVPVGLVMVFIAANLIYVIGLIGSYFA